MLYQKSLEIERRLKTVLELIRTGEYSTPALAKKVDVSIPTISRDVTALRQRGHRILAAREDKTWYYRLVCEASENAPPAQQLRRRPR